MKRSLRFGIVGAGAIAQSYADAATLIEGVRFTGVADTDKTRAHALAARLGCVSFANYQTMGYEQELDGVIVCTPPATHRPIAEHFCAGGVNVLCEKPLSVDVASARLMLAAAQEHGVILTMASKFRFVDDLQAAKRLIDAGTIGELVLVENSFTGPVDMTARWNSDKQISGGGVLIDNGTHAVDILRYLLGQLQEVQAVEYKRVQPLEVEDTVHLAVRSLSGAAGTSELSWSIAKERTDYISIYGSRGTIRVGWRESAYKHIGDTSWTAFGRGYHKVSAFAAQISNFAGAIGGVEELVVSPADALASVEAIDAAYASLQWSRWAHVRANYAVPVLHDRRRRLALSS